MLTFTLQVGGASGQNRFGSKTAIPIGVTAPVDGSPLVPHQESRLQAIGGAVTHSRFNDRKRPAGRTCDDSIPVARREMSKWNFDWEDMQWNAATPAVESESSTKHELAARRC